MKRKVDDIFKLLRQFRQKRLAMGDDELSDFMDKAIDRSVVFAGRKRKKRMAWISTAASVAVLIAAGITFRPEKEHRADVSDTKKVLTSVVHEKVVPAESVTDEIKIDETERDNSIAVAVESPKDRHLTKRVHAPQEPTEDVNIQQFIAQLNSTFDDSEDSLLAEAMTSVAGDIGISCDVMGLMREEIPLPALNMDETIGGIDNAFDNLEDCLYGAFSSFPWETIFGDDINDNK